MLIVQIVGKVMGLKAQCQNKCDLRPLPGKWKAFQARALSIKSFQVTAFGIKFYEIEYHGTFPTVLPLS